MTLEGHTKGVNCLGFSHGDQLYLVSGSDDYTAKLWDLKTMSCIGTLTGHTDNITSVSFHPELPLILTASEDGTIRSWNIHTLSLEKTTDIGMERAWSLSVLKGSNVVAAGFEQRSSNIQVLMGRYSFLSMKHFPLIHVKGGIAQR